MHDRTSNIVFYLIASLLIFAPLARGGVHGWAIGIIFLTVLTAVAIHLAAGIWQGKLRFIKTPLDLPILALVCLAFFSAVFSVHRPTSLVPFLLLLSCIAVYYLAIHTIHRRSQIKQLLYILLAISVFLALFGLVKSAGQSPFPWWDYPHHVGTTYLSATFGNRNHLAGWLEMTIPLLLAFALYRKKRMTIIIIIPLVLLLMAALVFTHSRGGWFGMIGAFMFMTTWLYYNNRLITSRWVVVMLNVVLVVGFIVVASSPVTDRVLTAEAGLEDGSLASRMSAWQGALELAEENPLLGSGPGTFSLAFPKYQPPGYQARFIHAHNDYLDFIAELGFGLLVIIIWMVIALFRHGIKKMNSRSTLTRGVTLGALAGITAILIHSAVDFNLQIPANAILFVILAALVAAPDKIRTSMW